MRRARIGRESGRAGVRTVFGGTVAFCGIDASSSADALDGTAAHEGPDFPSAVGQRLRLTQTELITAWPSWDWAQNDTVPLSVLPTAGLYAVTQVLAPEFA